jgi:tetratricopeptide (TPR) repeat protein
LLHEPGKFDKAAEALEKSLELDSNQYETLANLGDTYLELGRIEDAKNVLTKAEKIKSNDPRLHFLLGAVYLRLGDRTSALRESEILKKQDRSFAEDLEKLIEIKPEAV